MASGARERRAVVVADLGFGDAGKGLCTDHLVRELGAHTVVRWNGGAQAGHNVVTPDGRHHTFSQLGAGSFVPGVRTFLSRHVVVHPTALMVEASHFARFDADILNRVAVDEGALVTTHLHQAANRLRERARGDARHGSCGVGVGETVRDAAEAGGEVLRVGDLRDRRACARAMAACRERLRESLREALAATAGDPDAEGDRALFARDESDARWCDAVRSFVGAVAIVAPDSLTRRLADPGAVVLEGAQGVLLDEHRGFHPHTTWTTCTPDRARALLAEHGFEGEVSVLGVLRSYGVRHGAGPFPTEEPSLAAVLPEPHNDHGPWQGAFRVGWLDLVLLRYALEVAAPVDALALTHLDALARLPRVCVGVAHRLSGGRRTRVAPSAGADLAHQTRLAEELARATPVLEEAPREPEAFARVVEDALGARVALTSSGPSSAHVRRRP